MLKSFVYTTRVNSYFHLYVFFLKNPKFEIHPRIENKYTAYSEFISYSGMNFKLGILKKKQLSEIKNLLVSYKRKILTLESNGMIWD